ncbi:MAG: Rieske 2Fe-2S domain-containing protein [Candidatus Rokubacteria bacterium]|nr:Rieske 2Fe-2S domain-containing protein [Candidatus Rokubacteria bacterium]
MTLDVHSIKRLVESDRVHRRVYTDPALLELDRLFGRAWLLLGHASQVARPGDFVTTRMGRESVIVARHTDDAIHVLVNRCAHRGARVCDAARGHARQLVCPYHGWTYATDGALCAVPLPDGYDPPVVGTPEHALTRVPRVDSYRGFIFASLAARGPSLHDVLGPLRASFDDPPRRPEGRTLRA